MAVGAWACVCLGCFELAPLPEPAGCVTDLDCASLPVCDGAALCMEGFCVVEAACADECSGDGGCDEPGPDAGPDAGPGAEPPEPGPDPDACLRDGAECGVAADTPGVCSAGICEPIGCDSAEQCPAPGCATCQNETCGLKANCASVTLECEGLVGYRLTIACGGVETNYDCGSGDPPRHVGCRAGEPAQVCCGATGTECEALSLDLPVVATVLVFPEDGLWECPDDIDEAVCAHPGMVTQSEDSALCIVEEILLGKR